MDLTTMLEKCEREQWSVNDLDWSRTPRAMSKDDEVAIVQYFTDMAGIERLAGALFAEQRRRVDDPRLKKIFATFVRDEARHAAAAERLARYYNVHHYRDYQINPALVRFSPHFVDLIKYVSPEVANMYITGGELILDIALLRSLNEYVGDQMSQDTMDLINRDESRHIAIDYHMVELYSSPEYIRQQRSRRRLSLRRGLRAWWALGNVFYYGAPFFKAVFFEPMQLVDPSGKRLAQAFKRLQLLGTKPSVRNHPQLRGFFVAQDLYNDSRLFRALFGRLTERVLGVSRDQIARLYDENERARFATMSFDSLAEEALAAKLA
jgi:hypothetical protein